MQAQLIDGYLLHLCAEPGGSTLTELKQLPGENPLPLFASDMDGEGITEPTPYLPQMSLVGAQVAKDYVALRLSLRAHPKHYCGTF